MPSIFVTTVFVIAGAIASAAPDMLQRPRGSGAPRYDTSTEVTLHGTVQTVKQVDDDMGRRNVAGTHLIVKTDQETVEVHLGPTTFLTGQKLTLSAGDAVVIIGSA